MAKFITLAGRKQTGKDTSARYIKHLIEDVTIQKVYIVHFADVLKDACSMIFGIPRNDMETEVGKKKLTDIAWPMEQLRQKVPGTHDYEVVGYSPHHPQAGEPKMMTVREVLQFVGTELFRNQLDPDIWVKSVFRQQYTDDNIVVVADCRFPNEAEIAQQQGLLIHVARNTGLEDDGHISESALDDYNGYHARIDNNGSFEKLRSSLKDILVEHGFLTS